MKSKVQGTVLEALNQASWCWFIKSFDGKFCEPLNTLDCILINFMLEDFKVNPKLSPLVETPDYIINL